MSFDTLESLCNRFDPSVSLKEAFIKRADEFTKFVHGKDRNNDPIDFSNPNSILAKEIYKKQLFDSAQRMLNVNSWQKSWAGTGKIYKKLLPVINDKDNNLIKYYGITHFLNQITDNKGNYSVKAEQVIFDIFRGENESIAFANAIEEFGGRYPTIAYLFFLKDDKKFLPCAPQKFEESFQRLNINIKLAGECSWENYSRFIKIIDCIREIMPDYMQLNHEPTLLEAHSFVWIIGREYYDNWYKAQGYQKLMAIEKQRLQQEKEERERNKIPTKYLSDFSDEELNSLAPSLVNKVIHNTIHGEAIIVEFIAEPELAMTILYTDDEDGKYSKPIEITLNDVSKKNYYFVLDELSKTSSGEEKTEIIIEQSTAEPDTIEISDDENEQIEQAARMSIEQLRSVAASRESLVPVKLTVPTQQYRRDNFIAELAKRQAKGICQLCGNPAPFITYEGKPYLESHHIVWLSEGGPDTIENTAAVCPNCHKRLHYLNDENDVKKLIANKQASMQQ